MPVWLDVFLNIVGYVGFVAIATRAASDREGPDDDRLCGEKGRLAKG